MRPSGNIVKFGCWQGHSNHVQPQNGFYPPGQLMFTEDWKDTNLAPGLSITPFGSAQVSIGRGLLKISGEDSVVITLPNNTVFLAMFNLPNPIPTLSIWGMALLVSVLAIIAISFITIRARTKRS